MNAPRYLTIAVLLAWVCSAAAISGSENISGLLEMKRPKAGEIVAKPTLFRESRLSRLPLNLKQTEFLIDNPRVALALAHLYAPFLDPYTVEVRPDQVIHIHDPGKLAGDAELIDARPGRRIYLIAGSFDIFKIRFNGHMVLITVYSEQQGNAEATMESTTTAYIKVKSAFAGVLARMMDFLFPRKVDERIARFVRAAETIATAVKKDPADAYRKLGAAGEISAGELRDFARMFDPES